MLDVIYDALACEGISFSGYLEPKAGWQRFCSLRKSAKNSDVYVYIHPSFRYAKCGEWGVTEKSIFVRMSNEPLTQREREAIRLHKKKEEAQLRAAAAKAKRIWDSCSDAEPAHPYLVRKGIPPWYARQLDNRLILPVYNVSGQLISLQCIYPYGKRNKRFMSDGKVSGGFMLLGERITDTVRFAEGYATGMSVYMATGDLTVVCFSSGNMESVLKTTKELFDKRYRVICADMGKIGIADAIRAGKATGAMIITPMRRTQNKITDFNDLHVYEGLEAVEGQMYRYLF